MEWHTLTLSDIATVKSGSGFPKKYQGLPNESYPFYKVSDMNLTGNEESLYFENNTISSQIRGVLKATLFPVGSIVFPKVGAAIATNKKRILTKVGCVDNNVMGVIPKKDKIDSRFLYFWFQQHNLSEFANEAALPSIKKTTVEEWPVKLPICKIEQKRIVAILDKAFADLEQTRAKTEQNLKNARELFDSYLEQVFSQKGEGWVEKKFSECFKLRSGKGLTKKNMVNGPYPVYGGNGIAGMHNDYNLSENSVIIGRVGAICGNARFINESIWLTDNAFLVKDFMFNFDLEFLTYLLNYKNLRSLARQAAQPVISNSSLSDLKLNFPTDITVQTKIRNKLKFLRLEIESISRVYEEKLKRLDELKKSILQKAFSGELNAKA